MIDIQLKFFMMNKYLYIACVLVLAGCASPSKSPTTITSQVEGFQLYTASNGRVYRIETGTGKTTWLDGLTFRPVTEPTMPQLTVGKVYRGEDGTTTYRYEGAGRLEKWGLDRYNTSPQENTPSER